MALIMSIGGAKDILKGKIIYGNTTTTTFTDLLASQQYTLSVPDRAHSWFFENDGKTSLTLTKSYQQPFNIALVKEDGTVNNAESTTTTETVDISDYKYVMIYGRVASAHAPITVTIAVS